MTDTGPGGPASPSPRAFAPVAPSAVSAAPDGSWLAVVERAAITVVDPVTAAIHAEVGVAVDAECEVAWAGNPSRLVVVQRHPDHTVIHLVDVHTGPRPLGEVRLDQPVRVLASGALHALALGARGTFVISATSDRLSVGDFPSRTLPSAAGGFGPHHVIVAAANALEEWDTHAYQTRRRFRLPTPTDVRWVGGTDHLLWMVGQADPTRVDIFPLVNRGQPKLHVLPEPIAAISGHPRVDLLVWIGASGQARVLDLDGKNRSRPIGEAGQHVCALVAGAQISAVLAAPGEFLAIEVLDSRGIEPRRTSAIISVTDPDVAGIDIPPPTEIRPPDPMIELADTPEIVAPPSVGDLDTLELAVERNERAAAASARVDRAAQVAAATVDRAAAAADRIAAIGADASSPVSARELAQRLAGWRAAAGPSPGAATASPGPGATSSPRAARPAPPPRPWRELLLDWARTALAGPTPPPPPTGSPIDALIARLGLPAALEPAVALLYAAHLLGHDGVSPAELARAIARWDEALGNGALAASGVARWRRSRIRIAPVVRDALDDRPPRTGAITGDPTTPSTLATPCAVRVGSGRAADAATALVSRSGGAYLVPSATADATEAILEARARGAIALLEADVPITTGAARVLGPDGAAGDLAIVDLR